MMHEKPIEIAEISRRMADFVRANPSRIPSVIDAASKRVMSDSFGGYGPDFSQDEERWFDPPRIKPVSTPDISACREILIKAEAHFQLSAEFVYRMLEGDIAIIGQLPERIGDCPEMRAASSYTTMICNHELYLFKLLQHERQPRFNRGIPMSQRYYVSTNSAGPFIEYQAKVMTETALWDVQEEQHGKRRSYTVRPGPCLAHFMMRYFEVVAWANDGLAKAISRPAK
jgi:hypothetical protein